MVYVPPGQFVMGRRNTVGEALLGGVWPHPVRITRGFWIYRTEVSNAQYYRFVAATHARPPRPSLATDSRFNRPEQPVVGVSWQGALDYCRWAGGRLPTEAEWEYAASGAQGREYPWGDTSPDPSRAIFGRHPESEGPDLVGTRPDGATPAGVLDLAGSVWEWCSDWNGALGGKAATDPQGAPGGSWKVVKGGAWLTRTHTLRTRSRYGYSPEQRPFTTGFRPVLPESATALLLPN